MEAFEDRIRLGGAAAVKEATAFFMKDDPVHGALAAIAKRLDKEGVAYAVGAGWRSSRTATTEPPSTSTCS
jgi:hypothetical protein